MKSRATRSLLIFETAGLISLLAVAAPISAQDVPGIELCTRESRIDRRTSCLQSNVEYLQKVIAKNMLDAQQKLATAGRDIAALKDELATTKLDAAALAARVAELQARLDRLKKAAPPAAASAEPPPASPAPARQDVGPSGK
jgi:septal ring factor EnvC (AmiA/AmiB activator)